MQLYLSDFHQKIRRRKPFKRQDYDLKNLELAVLAVQTGMMRSTQAASHYGVPRTTIHTRLARLEQQYIALSANSDHGNELKWLHSVWHCWKYEFW